MFRLPKTTDGEDIIKTYDLEMGKVIFYKNFLVIEVAEGICFDYDKAEKLSKLTNLHFEDRPFGYISHRVNSYSTEPTDYLRIKEVFPNLKVFTVVIYNRFQETSVRIENMFYQDGILTFENLEKAKTWVMKQLS
ncbi:hypothetical protein D1816_04740 [Aquimarina sp. AD10]|uniref:STAS/SEC14 domain-containing protein n=1 Tax=Aquimarina aggregata TaxID=1642818 RepID=A0A163CEB0_9FLAO|nr:MULTISPECIES: hypothetical protein [Aquimarina]AXT59691.1 hypothetical protein D1816_04740 [Aquimarina sp. AD10]KZS42323.1 hypothetical protein AWE51_02465 [Aquimarina aggregata]RKM97567.1 hypothetical protein D7033_14320 [Aquimarina sp. AD10]